MVGESGEGREKWRGTWERVESGWNGSDEQETRSAGGGTDRVFHLSATLTSSFVTSAYVHSMLRYT